MDLKILASNIVFLRREKKWSQETLANFLNVTRQAVSKWENALVAPELDTLLLISKLFSVTINDLLEKPCKVGIESIEQIKEVPVEILRNTVKKYTLPQIIKAMKGMSPETQSYFGNFCLCDSLKQLLENQGPVPLKEVEQLHNDMVTNINVALSTKETITQ